MKIKNNTKIWVMILILPIIVGLAFVVYERYKPPRLSHLKSSFSIIKPVLSDVEYLSSFEQDRSWLICDRYRPGTLSFVQCKS